jgi:1-acyl-sn-glycerol-3-phosphate acyltransferase
MSQQFEAGVAVNQRPAGQPPNRPAARPARLRAVPAEPAAEPPAAGPSAVEPPAVESLDAVELDAVESPDATVDVWDRRVASALSFLRSRLTGGYEVDEFGFDQELTDSVFLPLLRRLYRDWFRVEVRGAENLPSVGSALVVANHSGVIALDALMLSVAIHDEHPAGRYLRLLGADLVFRMPVISELARKHGSTLACSPDAERLLRAGELVGVFPEGFKGVGKLYRHRYKLQRFGRGGFVSAALRTGTPIVPVSIVGAEETYPMLGNIKPLARLLGIPYFPVTPTFPWLGPLGLIPLPSKWVIAFGEPIETAKYADQADDPAVVFNLSDQVRETIQQTLHKLLAERDSGAGGG